MLSAKQRGMYEMLQNNVSSISSSGFKYAELRPKLQQKKSSCQAQNNVKIKNVKSGIVNYDNEMKINETVYKYIVAMRLGLQQ